MNSADEAALKRKVSSLEDELATQQMQHQNELAKLHNDLDELRRIAESLEERNQQLEVVHRSEGSSLDFFSRHVEWTINDFEKRMANTQKGESIWSPKFRSAGIDDMLLEFFPKGREKTTFDGFCSLFLWCPQGTKIKYQLSVGKFLRAPDEDEYTGRIGHGHSNFCPIEPEVDKEKNCIKITVDYLEVMRLEEVGSRGMRIYSRPVETMVAKEIDIIQKQNVNRVVWKITNFSRHAKEFPRGSSMWSKVFTAAGIREILLELYPNGSANTTKDGYCAFYVRCPEGVSIIVTLFVGKVKKGPIKTVFEASTGKGLPDFCNIQSEVNKEDDSIEVGIELQNQPQTTLTIES